MAGEAKTREYSGLRRLLDDVPRADVRWHGGPVRAGTTNLPSEAREHGIERDFLDDTVFDASQIPALAMKSLFRRHGSPVVDVARWGVPQSTVDVGRPR